MLIWQLDLYSEFDQCQWLELGGYFATMMSCQYYISIICWEDGIYRVDVYLGFILFTCQFNQFSVTPIWSCMLYITLLNSSCCDYTWCCVEDWDVGRWWAMLTLSGWAHCVIAWRFTPSWMLGLSRHMSLIHCLNSRIIPTTHRRQVHNFTSVIH